MKTQPILSILAVAMMCPLAMAEDKLGTKAPSRETVTETTTTTKETTVHKTGEPAATSIAGMLRAGATFSIFAKAMDAAEVTQMFADKGAYTVFAPTDDAFMKLPKDTLMKLMLPENKEKLRSLVLYHAVAGDFTTSNLAEGKVKSVNGEPIKIDIGKSKMKADDAKVVNPDLKADNGTIHVIDHVIVPKSLDGFAGLKAD
ncbi:MAG: fasciclin domain-containing protein [Luteolibacter sp.]